MKKEELFEILIDIDENYIETAHAVEKKKVGYAWKSLAMAAACFILLVVAGIPMVTHLSSNNQAPGADDVKDKNGNLLVDIWGNSETNNFTDSTEATTLFDLFLDGKIAANYSKDDRDAFYITDLSIDEEDALSYSIGERVDLDNDGEEELIINGPYGGVYLDAREKQVYVLDEGWGTAGVLSYTKVDGQTWIVHSDVTHSGRKVYDFTLYNGAGEVVDAFSLRKEFWDTPNEPDGPNTIYTYRDEKITKDEYDELLQKMLTGKS